MTGLRRRGLLGGGAALLAGCGLRPEVEGGFAGASPDRGHRLRDAAAWPAPSVLRRADVVIAGGGIAGLAAARRLRQGGVEDVALLELEDEPGGNSRGLRLGGMEAPQGAHYLPVPGDGAPQVRELLEELGLARLVAGRWVYEERHLCHSPQERLFLRGQWQEGLLPQLDLAPSTLAQYRRFAGRVTQLRRESPWPLPLTGPAPAVQRALDTQPFAAWLSREGLDDAQLRWYLDYCCRDDYGAGAQTVSAWAGLHYFASRHGFAAPGDEAEREPLLTWPEGNAWLARRMAAPLGERLRAARVVLRIAQERSGVSVDALDVATGAVERWQARACVVALPLAVAARVVQPAPEALRQAGTRPSAPWVVVNLQLDRPLRDRGGAAPSWDNVLYGTAGLGYVDAGHQRLSPAPAPTVLSWYRPLGGEPGARALLLQAPWSHWKDAAVAELSAAHPDLAERLVAVRVSRFGHAMAVPVPGTRGDPALAALAQPQDRLHFAHADLSGYSVFEEAFTHGHRAGGDVLRALSRA